MKILMVLTSHDQLGNSGEKTGLWLEEFAAPYYQFIDAGAQVTLASPKGGRPPIDPKSLTDEALTGMTTRFKDDQKAQEAFANTVKLSEIDFNQFDGVFYPGGHGPLWDLANDQDSIKLIENFYQAGKPVGAVCHAPAVLRQVEIDGVPLVKGKRVTGFSNSEEEAVGLTQIVPFLLEDELRSLGGLYEKGEDWKSFTLADGLLVTGQNPASSKDAAQYLIKLITPRESHHPGTLDSLGTGRISMTP